MSETPEFSGTHARMTPSMEWNGKDIAVRRTNDYRLQISLPKQEDEIDFGDNVLLTHKEWEALVRLVAALPEGK